MSRMISAFVLMVSLLCGQISAATADWANVLALAAGDRIQVDLSTGQLLKGKVDHVTPQSVFVLANNKVTAVQKNDVTRLYLKKKGDWKKSTLIGTAIGAAAGGGIGAGVMERESGYGAAVAGTVALFAAIGAGVGYLFRPDKKVLIYEAPSPSH
jgi:hypothetical protein